MRYWLVKSEPFKFSWDDFVLKGQEMWDGVRNYQARNNLKAMKLDDPVLFYHSNEGKAVIGLAKVVREYYPDPTTNSDAWVAVDLAPVEAFKCPVTLEQIKHDNRLQHILLIRQSRLSVVPLNVSEFDTIISLGNHEN